MVVGFQVKFYWFHIGGGDFLHSFFSTVCYHLEQQKWGSRYPFLMNDLYNGDLGPDGIDEAINELENISIGLSKIAPSEIVWDIEDLELRPPWGDNISPEITSLGNYFVTSDGEDLFAVLKRALLKAKELQLGMTIESL